ncbi:MAG: hypothetical protein KAJ19_17810, partial [Gammaproteobacteria bacterium]|nr:hypothetical protein [Gammaproteobacteria bacterium]
MDKDKKVAEAIASMMSDPARRDALAEIIVEFVQPNHITADFISGLLATRRLKPGDSLVKKVRKGIDVRTLVPGAVHLASEITISERMNYVLDGADVKVTYNQWELEMGEIGTIQEIRREMALKLNDYYINKVFTALSTVWSASNTPNNYTSVGGTITGAALESAINYINQTTPGAKAIVGARSVVTPITKFGAFWTDGTNVGYDPNDIQQIRQTGWLGKYYGVPVKAVEQIWDNPEDFNSLVPTDKILIIGEGVGEFITYGDVKTKQWSDMNPTPPQWMLEIYQ